MRRVAGALIGIGMAVAACGGPGSSHVNVVLPDAGGGNTGGSSDGGGTDAGPADAGSDAGPTADCTGLVPSSIGSALTFDVHDATGKECSAATCDGQGMIVAEAHDAGTPAAPWTDVQWNIYDTRGVWQGNFNAGTALFGQPVGFQGYSGNFDTTWDPYGNPRAFVPLQPRSVLAQRLKGGTIAFGYDGTTGIAALRVDASGNDDGHTSAQVSGSFQLLSGAEDASGATVVVFEAGQGIRFIWFDLVNRTSSATYSVGRDAAEVIARPLIGGGVAVRLDGKWTATLQPNDATPHPPPAWLRDGTDFAPVRGGKAYAVWQAAGNAVDIVSAQGNACGGITFSGVTALSLGADGTVIGSTGAGGCSKIFWKAALK